MCSQLGTPPKLTALATVLICLALGCRPLEPRVERNFKTQEAQATITDGAEKITAPPKTPDIELSLAEKALAILQAKCESCHNPETAVISAFDYIMYVEKMIDERQLVPGSIQESRLYQRIADGTMPPQGSPQLTEEEDSLIQEWITSGTPITQSFDQDDIEDREFFTRTKAFATAVEDIRRLAQDHRRHIRYFSATNLYNSGFSNRVIGYAEAGANKLINTFSTNQDLKRIQSIHHSGTLFRVDLRDFGITPEKWETVEVFYPYHHVTTESSALAYLQQQTNSTLPIMRIDWFLANAGQPPVYYEMIGTPATLAQLQNSLDIDTTANIRSRSVIRAGFEDSMVSKDHRVIERHNTSHGYLWISYEFAEPQGNQNIFTHPFGPTGAFNQSQTNRQFELGGHELFYTRPNGMLAFAIYDFAGNRMHEAPALITQGGQLTEQVIAGRTCHICHGNGPIFKADQVKSRIQVNLNDFERQLLEDLYVDPEVFRKQIEQDSQSYGKAMIQLGIAPASADPIASIAQSFEENLTKMRLAAELSVSESSLDRHIEENKALKNLLESCLLVESEAKVFKRSCFERNFKTLSQEIWLQKKID